MRSISRKITFKKSAETEQITVQIHLPEEVIVHILLRLPPKSVLCFKSVSKAWHALIDSPFFLDCHLDFIKTKPIMDRRHLLHYLWKPSKVPSIAGVAMLLGPGDVVMDIEDPPFLNGRDQLGLHGCLISTANLYQFPGVEDKEFPSSMWGPVNGVYCIRIMGKCSFRCTILLWSPGTRQVHVLPPIPPLVLPSPFADYDFQVQHLICGYGYDPLNNDYKVVLITACGGVIDGYYHHFYCIHLYSLATNAWKQLDLVEEHGCIAVKNAIYNSFYYSRDDGFFLNGACHWIVSCIESNMGLLSFDFGDKALKVTLIPSAIMKTMGKCPTLAAVDGYLAAVCALDCEPFVTYQGVSHVFDVYVMRENGVDESWTRAYRIKLTSSFPGRFIGIVGDEFFVQEADKKGRVVSYRLGAPEPEKERYEYCCLDVPWIHVLPYQESLVSVEPHVN